MAKLRFDQIAINCTKKKKPEESDKDLYVGLEHLDTGSLYVTRWGNPIPLKGEKLVMHKGDVLLGKRNAYLRRAAVAPHDGLFSAHGMVLNPQENVVDKEFFPFFVASDYFFDEAIRISVGSLSPTINWKDLAKIEFELPSIEEQKRKARALWAIEETCQSYIKLLKETDNLIESMFTEMISTSGCENTLGDFVKRHSPERCGDRDLPVLSVTKEKAIVFQEERFSSAVASVDKSKYLVVPRGYIVQGIHIDEGNFGLQNIVDEGIVSPAYKIWKITSNNIVPELLEFYLRSQRAIDYYAQNYQGTTVKRRQTIKADDLLAMPLDLPDVKKQKEFWNFVCKTEQSKNSIQNALQEARNMQRKIFIDGIES